VNLDVRQQSVTDETGIHLEGPKDLEPSGTTWRKRLLQIFRRRYLVTFFLVAGLKLLAGLWVYSLVIASSGRFLTDWIPREIGAGRLLPTAPFWPFLFQGWDSVFYVVIARFGYVQFPLYAFFPAFPALIKAFGYLLGDYWAASAFLSIILGIAWVPVFQKMAEHYLSERDAFEATILTAMFPYVFVFTTIAYTEALFILATVSAWYLHLKGKHVAAGFLVALATMTRAYGILILLPMIVNVRKVALRIVFELRLRIAYIIPIASLLAWIVYLRMATGSWFTLVEAERQWIGKAGENTLSYFLWQLFTLHPISPIPFGQLTPIFVFSLLFVVVILFLASRTWTIDHGLAVYSWLYLILLLISGYAYSLFRLASFVFPTWLVMRTGSRIGLALVTVFFLITSILVWFLFLMGYFVG
jgi:hypothetical protein